MIHIPGRTQIHVLYWIYVMALSMDFRGSGGVTPAHFLMMAGTFGAGILLIGLGRKNVFQRPTGWITLLWGIYLLTTIPIAVYGRVGGMDYFKASLPVHLTGLSLFVVQVVAGFGFTPGQILRPAVIGGTINAVWKVYHGLTFNELSIEEVRVQILSPALPFLIAYAVGCVVVKRRLEIHTLLILGLTLGIVAISVTRTYLITFAFAGMASLCGVLLAISMKFWTSKDITQKIKNTGIAAGVGLFCLVLLGAVRPVVFERWADRIVNDAGGASTVDITFLTRQAEAHTILETVAKSPTRYLHGSGYGTEFNWHDDYFPELAIAYGSVEAILKHAADKDYTFPGHSTWTYALLTGGAYGVLMHIFIFCAPMVTTLIAVRNARSVSTENYCVAFLGLVISAAYLSQTFTDNPFRERYGGLLLGIGAALPQAVYNIPYFVHARRRRKVSEAEPDEPEASVEPESQPVS